MKISTFIIDDEAHAVDLLGSYVMKTDGLELAGTATDPVSALSYMTGPNPPRLLLLDVDMPGMSGLELARLISPVTLVIFVTSYREFGVEAFELSAVDYLLKPISYARFFAAVQKAMQKIPAGDHDVKERDQLFVKGDVKEKFIRIIPAEIIVINAAQNYIDIHLTAERVTTYLTLKELLAELPVNDFCQVHRSYIISRKYIAAIEKGQVRMVNNQAVPLGKAFQDPFFKWLGPNILISSRLQNH